MIVENVVTSNQLLAKRVKNDNEARMMKSTNSNAEVTSLEQMVKNTCFCKLKEQCIDKDSAECMRHRNIVAEFMQEKHFKKTK